MLWLKWSKWWRLSVVISLVASANLVFPEPDSHSLNSLCWCFFLARNLWSLLFKFLGHWSWAGNLNLGCMNMDVFAFVLSTLRHSDWWLHEPPQNKTSSCLERSVHTYSLEASADSLMGAAFSFLAFCAAGVSTAVYSLLWTQVVRGHFWNTLCSRSWKKGGSCLPWYVSTASPFVSLCIKGWTSEKLYGFLAAFTVPTLLHYLLSSYVAVQISNT